MAYLTNLPPSKPDDEGDQTTDPPKAKLIHTQQQKEEIAAKGNEFLLEAYAEHQRGQPLAEQAVGAKLTFEQKQELLRHSFKSILNNVKNFEPTLLTDPHLRKILTKPPVNSDWITEMNWNLAIEVAENDLKLEASQSLSSQPRRSGVRVGGFAIGQNTQPQTPPPQQRKKHWWQR